MASSGRKGIDGAQTVADKQGPGTLEKYFQIHFDEVWQLFETLEAAELTVKPEKCHFLRRTVKYAGHILKDGKRFPDLGKVEAIGEWDHRIIMTSEALEGFLGLVGWYQIYIPGITRDASPLIEALQGKYKFESKPENATVELDATGLRQETKKGEVVCK